MSRRKSKPRQQRSDRWVISYADLLTMLFAFFVVMYAVSSVNLEKYKSVSESLNKAFESVDNKYNNQLPSQHQSTDHSGFTQTFPISKVIKNKLEHDPLLQKLSKDLVIKQHPDWMEIEINSNMLFNSGKAKLNDGAKPLLKQLAESFSSNKYLITVEGYTDDRPIRTRQFPSNWELSASRSAAVGRQLIRDGLDPEKLTIIGFGAQQPIANNETVEGRAKNRRVIIVVAKNHAVQRLLNPQASQAATTIEIEPKTTEQGTVIVKEIKLEDGSTKYIRAIEPDKKSKDKDTTP